MATIVTGTFTGTGQSSTLDPTSKADVSLSGTFVATVSIERRIGGNWVVIESMTAVGERAVENATGLEMRLNCSAYTSGTVTYAMVAK